MSNQVIQRATANGSVSMTNGQLDLFVLPVVAVMPVELDYANQLLIDWQHKLGSVHRPFRSEAWAVLVDGEPVSVAVSASIVSSTVAGYRRDEVVELARQASRPGDGWASRVMLRLWRSVLAQRWKCWTVKAVISYSHNATHTGDIYRFDGWRKVRDTCGSSGGGSWSRSRYATDAVHGKKTLWIWDYERTGADG